MFADPNNETIIYYLVNLPPGESSRFAASTIIAHCSATLKQMVSGEYFYCLRGQENVRGRPVKQTSFCSLAGGRRLLGDHVLDSSSSSLSSSSLSSSSSSSVRKYVSYDSFKERDGNSCSPVVRLHSTRYLVRYLLVTWYH